MKELPLITIGMCCYRSPDTVERAINSALSQDYPNYELIVIDDGSGDETPDVIKKSIKGFKHARLIQHKTNKTFPGALNTLIKEAKGEYIAIFDDDDESRPSRLSVQYNTIIEYQKKTEAELIACWGSGHRRYPNGYELKLEAIGSQKRPPIGTEIADLILYFGKTPEIFFGSGTPSCSLMTAKNTYEMVGPYDETMFRSEDADFAIRLGLKGGHFIGCKEDVIIQHATGGAEKKPEVTYDSYSHLIEKYSDYLKGKKRYSYAVLWNKLRLHHFSRNIPKAFLILTILFIKHPVLTWTHLWSTAPKRIIHEIKMAKK